MPDLELLSRKCKKYRIKRFLKYSLPILLLLALISLFEFRNFLDKKSIEENQKMVAIKIDNNMTKNSANRVDKPKEKSIKRVKKATVYNDGVKVIQFLAVSKGGKETLSSEKRRFESMGFSCYIKKDSDEYFKLRCLIPKNFSEIKKILKDKKIDFFLPTESKEFLEQLNLKTNNISSIMNRPIKKKNSITKLETPIKVEETLKLERDQTPSLIASKKATLEELIKQFSHRPGFSRAIMISRTFYNRKDFKNAAKWAKKANSLDREREEGWILYAKSIYALGDKERAIKILKLYLSFKSSREARKLMMQFERGMR